MAICRPALTDHYIARSQVFTRGCPRLCDRHTFTDSQYGLTRFETGTERQFSTICLTYRLECATLRCCRWITLLLPRSDSDCRQSGSHHYIILEHKENFSLVITHLAGDRPCCGGDRVARCVGQRGSVTHLATLPPPGRSQRCYRRAVRVTDRRGRARRTLL